MTTPKTWTTRDGSVVRISEMTDSHIVNAIRMLRRNDLANRIALASCWESAFSDETMAGIAAQSAADDLFDDEYSDGPGEFFPVYDDLVREADRRKLKVNG